VVPEPPSDPDARDGASLTSAAEESREATKSFGVGAAGFSVAALSTPERFEPGATPASFALDFTPASFMLGLAAGTFALGLTTGSFGLGLPSDFVALSPALALALAPALAPAPALALALLAGLRDDARD
jgi:hypothetical protein